MDIFKVAPLLIKRFPDAIVGGDASFDYEETCYNLAMRCEEEFTDAESMKFFGEELHCADDFYEKIVNLPNLMHELINEFVD